MELPILVNTSGKQVVVASELFRALELKTAHYTKAAQQWIKDVYRFHDGIRTPKVGKDYAKRLTEHSAAEDFFLSVEFAQLITLHSRSRIKQKVAGYLSRYQQSEAEAGWLTSDAVKLVLDLTREMGVFSNQITAEERHQAIYRQRNGALGAAWFRFRANLMGVEKKTIEARYTQSGRSAGNRTLRELLFKLDRYELVRIGVIDWAMASGRPSGQAKAMGKLAKQLAIDLKIEVYDDRNAPLLEAILANQKDLQTVPVPFGLSA